MPFGLHEAAATFQRLVDTMLSLYESYILTYLDTAKSGKSTYKICDASSNSYTQPGSRSTPKRAK